MPHSYASNLVHIVFSTSERRRSIAEEVRLELLPYMNTVVQNLGSAVLRLNGVEDHVHALVALKASMSLSELVGKMKANSSRFVHDRWRVRRTFAWQEGFGAFSVSRSNADAVIEYIDRQQEHHKRFSFEDEFRELLTKHGIEFDERFVFG